MVVPARADRVPATVPEIRDHQVNLFGEERSEGMVQIDCEPIAMAGYQAGAGIGNDAPSDRAHGAIVELNLAY